MITLNHCFHLLVLTVTVTGEDSGYENFTDCRYHMSHKINLSKLNFRMIELSGFFATAELLVRKVHLFKVNN